MLKVRCLTFKREPNSPTRCPCRAYLNQETLQVVKVVGEHSCDQDPEWTTQLCMETEMKQLAATTSYSLRDIFDIVGQRDPAIASRISLERIFAAMKTRRLRAKENHS